MMRMIMNGISGRPSFSTASLYVYLKDCRSNTGCFDKGALKINTKSYENSRLELLGRRGKGITAIRLNLFYSPFN